MFLEPVKPRLLTLLSTQLSPHQLCSITSINTFKNWCSECSPHPRLELTGSHCFLMMRTHVTPFLFLFSTQMVFLFADVHSNSFLLTARQEFPLRLYQRQMASSPMPPGSQLLCLKVLSVLKSLTQPLSFCFSFLAHCCSFPRSIV